MPRGGGGRPAKGYRNADGKRVPGVTTITGRFKESGGLIRWAHRMGLEGKDIDWERDSAAEAGTIAHQWVDDTIHGRDLTGYPDVDEALIEKARLGLQAFRDWQSQTKMEIVETETPLVSEEYQYGGTFDAIGTVNGKRTLIDFKTSAGIYSDFIIQVAAYRNLVEERDGAGTIQALQILRLGKEYGDFHAHSFPTAVLDLGWEQFKLLRQAYELDKKLRKAA